MMTCIERKDSVGAGWSALSIDGYIPDREKLVNIYRGVYPKRDDKWTPKLTGFSRDIILKEASDYIRFEYEGSLRAKAETKNLCSYCHLFLVRPDEEKKALSPFASLSDEFLNDRNRVDYRQILIFQKGCSHMKACTENLLQKIGFRVKEESTYRDYLEFVKDCEKLIDNILEVYVVPCIVVEDRLKRIGFECAPL